MPKTFWQKNIGGFAVLQRKSARINNCWQIKVWRIGCELPKSPKVLCYSYSINACMYVCVYSFMTVQCMLYNYRYESVFAVQRLLHSGKF